MDDPHNPPLKNTHTPLWFLFPTYGREDLTDAVSRLHDLNAPCLFQKCVAQKFTFYLPQLMLKILTVTNHQDVHLKVTPKCLLPHAPPPSPHVCLYADTKLVFSGFLNLFFLIPNVSLDLFMPFWVWFSSSSNCCRFIHPPPASL